MRNIFRVGVVLGLIGLFCASLLASTSPLSFLETPVGARAIGLGGAGVALADDANAAYWNAAGLALLKQQSIQSMIYTDPFGNRTLFANYVYPSFIGSFGLSFFSTQADGLLVVNQPVGGARPISSGSFSDTSSYWLLSYGRKIQKNFYIGFSLKGVNRQLYSYSASGLGVDFGLLYTPIEQFNLGLNLQNMIPVQVIWNTPDNYSETAPLNIKIGLSLMVRDVLLSSEVNISNGELLMSNGIEAWLNSMAAVRFGFNNSGYSLGSSLRYDAYQIDISMTQQSDSLLNDLIYKISLGTQFGQLNVPAETVQKTVQSEKIEWSKNSLNEKTGKRFRVAIFSSDYDIDSGTYNNALNMLAQALNTTKHFDVYSESSIRDFAISKKVPFSDFYDSIDVWEAGKTMDIALVIFVEAHKESQGVRYRLKFLDVLSKDDFFTSFTTSIKDTIQLNRTVRKIAEKLATERYPLLD